jgi:hypothetical protein
MHKTFSNLEEYLQSEYSILSLELSERGRRKWAAIQAKRLGHGGKALVKKITGLSYPTIRRGLLDIECKDTKNIDKIRRSGAGRKTLIKTYPNLQSDMESLLNDSTIGDPENPLRWTSKSTRNLCDALKNKGYDIAQRSVCNILNLMGYSLQANRKLLSGKENPDRDAQFNFINQKVISFQGNNKPVISVDAKKKELIGNFKNNGQEFYQKKQSPKVNVYDFLDKEKGKVAPYGIYDLAKNKGWVSVGISSDTAKFAVNSIRSWWREMGKADYHKAREIYINADGGGSNGYRTKLWKTELQKLSNEINMAIHVSHFPPGTSKWNKIEHRMFSFISKNWRGRPLIDHATVVSLIGNTKTKTGLEIKARLDENEYQTGIVVSDKEIEKVNLERDEFHGEWNYIIRPD